MGLLGGAIAALVSGFILFKYAPIPLWAKVSLVGIVAGLVGVYIPL